MIQIHDYHPLELQIEVKMNFCRSILGASLAVASMARRTCTSISIINGLIINPCNKQLLVDLTAQLVKHCTAITEVRV